MYCSRWCLLWLLSDSAECLHFSFYPSFYHPHPLRPCKFLASLLLIRLFFAISLSGLEMFKSASLWEIFFGSYVKVLSVASWNYLGAKLIALDPTSHCNRLSANLGFSHCSQVSPRQWLHQAVCSSQGFDLCHTLLGSPLSHTNFVLSVAVMFVRTLFSFVCLTSICPFSHTEHLLNCVQLPLNLQFFHIFSFPCIIACSPLMHSDFFARVLCFSSTPLFCLLPCDVIDHLPQWLFFSPLCHYAPSWEQQMTCTKTTVFMKNV